MFTKFFAWGISLCVVIGIQLIVLDMVRTTSYKEAFDTVERSCTLHEHFTYNSVNYFCKRR